MTAYEGLSWGVCAPPDTEIEEQETFVTRVHVCHVKELRRVSNMMHVQCMVVVVVYISPGISPGMEYMYGAHAVTLPE